MDSLGLGGEVQRKKEGKGPGHIGQVDEILRFIEGRATPNVGQE